jgi:CheY-like chemotaxis protein
MRVLICDDNTVVRSEIRHGLESAGLEVVGEAGNGLEAERLAGELHPEAILLDLAMPGKDGIEVLPSLRERHPGARIVVFSGFEAAGLGRRVQELGADAYLEKGCPLEQLVAALRGEYVPPVEEAEPAEAPDTLIGVLERERTSIAAQIHDGPVQLLVAASLRLQAAAGRGDVPPEVALKVSGQIDAACAELRRVMGRLLGSSRAFGAPEGARAVSPADREAATAGTILVVEDEEIVRDMLRQVLEDEGFEVLVAADGNEALALCSGRGSAEIDLLLTDFVVPGLSGPALAERVLELWPRTGILCMSGYGEGEAGELPAGSRFIQKPFSPLELVRQVRSILASR